MEPRIGRLLSLPTGTWADEDFEFSHQASQVALAGERDCRKGKGEKEGSLPLTGYFALFFFARHRHHSPHSCFFGQNSVMWPHLPARGAGRQSLTMFSEKRGTSLSQVGMNVPILQMRK